MCNSCAEPVSTMCFCRFRIVFLFASQCSHNCHFIWRHIRIDTLYTIHSQAQRLGIREWIKLKIIYLFNRIAIWYISSSVIINIKCVMSLYFKFIINTTRLLHSGAHTRKRNSIHTHIQIHTCMQSPMEQLDKNWSRAQTHMQPYFYEL